MKAVTSASIPVCNPKKSAIPATVSERIRWATPTTRMMAAPMSPSASDSFSTTRTAGTKWSAYVMK